MVSPIVAHPSQHSPTLHSQNKMSVDVSFTDLATAVPTLAMWLVNVPKQMLEVFHEAAYDVTRELYPNLDSILQSMFVRITNVPGSDNIRDIR